MNSFKSGSGNLDFDGDGDDTATDDATEAATTSVSEGAGDETDDGSSETEEYPYFVRRSNVTDERTVRLEAHVREAVAQQESTFRADLAAALGTDSVAKTDAREFALLYAFQHPEAVAELMQEDGYGVLD